MVRPPITLRMGWDEFALNDVITSSINAWKEPRRTCENVWTPDCCQIHHCQSHRWKFGLMSSRYNRKLEAQSSAWEMAMSLCRKTADSGHRRKMQARQRPFPHVSIRQRALFSCGGHKGLLQNDLCRTATRQAAECPLTRFGWHRSSRVEQQALERLLPRRADCSATPAFRK